MKFNYFKDKLPIGDIICTSCRIELANICDSYDKTMNLCVNPFESDEHIIGKDGRKVTSEFISQHPNFANRLVIDRIICNKCRMKVIRKRTPVNQKTDEHQQSKTNRCISVENEPSTLIKEDPFVSTNASAVAPNVDIDGDDPCSELLYSSSESSYDCESEEEIDDDIRKLSQIDDALKGINQIATVLKIPCVTSDSNFSEVYNQCTIELKKRFEILSKRKLICSPKNCDDCENLFHTAVSKFSSSDRRQKYTMLTTIPTSYSKNKIVKSVGCGKYIVTKAFQLREKEGPFSYPNMKRVAFNQVSEDLKQKVVNFYKSPSVSRIQPGRRESYLMKNKEGNKEPVAKQRLLLTLHELYNEFLDTHLNGEPKISLTSFYLLKPRECVWMTNKLYQQTCSCIIHENFNQLLVCFEKHIDLKWVLENIPCNVENESCMLGLCSLCPKNLNKLFGELIDADNLTFYQWKQTDRVEMLKITETVDEFETRVLDIIPSLLKHHFIVRKQNAFIEKWKLEAKSKPGEALVKVDFAMNHNFVYQNEAQSAHWNRRQATLHPFHVTFFCTKEQKLRSHTFVAISDHLQHNTITFYAFQCQFVKLMKNKFPQINKLVYVSDGSSAQYKNRFNVTNLLNHKNDFGLDADWEFFPTAHGKSKSSCS